MKQRIKKNNKASIFSIGNVLLLIAILIYPTYFVMWEYPQQRDVWGVLDRAQISAESEEMYKLVDYAITTLENRNGIISKKPQTEGYCAIWFQQPANSLEMQYTAMKNIRTRLERTNKFDKNSVEYQAAIDDIRGTIRDLPYLDCWIWHWEAR